MKATSKSNGISTKESIVIDLRYEIDTVDFSDLLKEDDSFQFILSILEIWCGEHDNSITDEQLSWLIDYLGNSTIPLDECYWNMIKALDSEETIKLLYTTRIIFERWFVCKDLKRRWHKTRLRF